MNTVLDIAVANVKLLPMFLALGGALGLLYWRATPGIVRGVLQNGGGEVVRRIVREENAVQSDKTHAAITGAVAPLTESVTRVRERLARLEGAVGVEAPG